MRILSKVSTMATTTITTFLVTKNLNFAFLILFAAIAFVSSFQFQVGGETGWTILTANNSDLYNRWAAKNRFHVGDSIYFKYKKDSVLVVNNADYKNCIVSTPISKHEDGSTIIQFDRSGFFYFISGQPGHCKSGQKMVIDVMADQSQVDNPEPAPSPKASEIGGSDGDGWISNDWGPPSMNSTMKLTSYFMTTLAVVLVILYMFM